MKKVLFTTVITAIVLFLQSFNSYAQDIEGIQLGDKLTKEQIIQKFGEPKEIKSGFDEYDGNYQSYIYNGMTLWIVEGNFATFYCDRRGIKMFLSLIKNGIEVGDKFDTVIKGEFSKYITYKHVVYIDQLQIHRYEYSLNTNPDSQIDFDVKDNIITGISAGD